MAILKGIIYINLFYSSIEMPKIKLVNPWNGKESEYDPFSKTAVKIYKYMIEEMGLPSSIVPKGLKYNNGRIFFTKKFPKGTTRGTKARAMNKKLKFTKFVADFEKKFKKDNDKRQERLEEIVTKLKDPQADVVVNPIARKKFKML